MIRAFATLALLTASATGVAAGLASNQSQAGAATAGQTADAPLAASTPWWERMTVTIAANGKAGDCRYETSQQAGAATKCEVDDSETTMAGESGQAGAKSDLTRITFERRFSPGSNPDSGAVAPGNTLLGGQVMALAIDQAGRVAGCRVVAKSGAMTPDYGCPEARAERFKASAPVGAGANHRAYMTIIVYGHSEHMV